MTSAVDFFVHQELSRLRSQALSAQSSIQRARSFREICHAKQSVHPHSVVRAVAHSVPEFRQVDALARQKAKELFQAQLKELMALCEDARQKEVARRARQDWVFLRGNFPDLAAQVRQHFGFLPG